MFQIKRSAGVLILCTGLWWVAFVVEAHAGLFDRAAEWGIGLLLMGGMAGAAGCVQAVRRIKQGAFLKPAVETKPVDVYEILYATNREISAGSFTCELSETLRFGCCRISVPESHKYGSLGSPVYMRVVQQLRTGSDDSLRIIEQENWPLSAGPAKFVDSVRKFLIETSDQILVYIHGFNVSFDGAVLRAAQIGFDLKVPGVMAAFCWASKGSAVAYPADEDTIKLSAQHLADFLSLLHANFPDRTINIMAHSMGNRALMDVLQNANQYPGLSGAKFGQIFLAAPDIDSRAFRKAATAYSQLSARTTLYVCAADRALETSGIEHDNIRTGYCPPGNHRRRDRHDRSN
ncbi:alpha/beta hydrolase [Mesorhizobium huakuii]|uniref:Alpha/beta hydrolase n=1 Tax=Mesorhizobium huakuii TaxID=28104 RepID=A0A7G6SMU9_9HYPH|nr:alpha/beta hydrolase [Mesorhizobium huakuii]QND55831.1 alpha/beta hydrolase [Mesorhizobium huakuii]